MPIIEVEHVVKRYRLGQVHGLRESLKRLAHAKTAQPRNTLNALDGVDFSVEAGEVLGIIGTNGAGKSTLLKVLSGITTPTSGRMVARGRVAPLIEVGAGLIADLTGRENVYLNGVILGMSLNEIKRKFDDIVGFAELEKFIDTPIKRYSSGMAIRLGFAIATAVDCEILIVDEVLAVGDVAFQRKCFDRIEDIIKKQGKTILLVSHNIRQVERLCTRTLLLDHGRILADGETRAVARQFYERSNEKMRTDAIAVRASKTTRPEDDQWPDLKLISIRLIDDNGQPTDVVPYKKDLTVRIRFSTKKDMNGLVFGVGVHTSDMLYLATHDSDRQMSVERLVPGDYEIDCIFRRTPLVPGVYSLRLGVAENLGATQAFYAENLLHFQVSAASGTELPPVSSEGFFALDGDWRAPVRVETGAAALEAA